MNSFWWGSGSGSLQGIHWKSWDRLCVPKDKGGIEFQKIHEVNLSLLGKQAQKFISNPSCLVSHLFKARYFPKCSFLNSSLGHNPSYIWCNIMATQGLIRDGCRICVGSGESIYVWGDPWLLGT